jgi:hypothetical protein
VKLSLTRPWGAGALAEPSNIRTVYFLLFITVSLLYFYWQITSFARQSLQILLLLISWMIWMYVPVYQNIWRENIRQSLFRGRTVSLRFGNESNHRDLPSQSSEVLSMSLSENKKNDVRVYARTRVPLCTRLYTISFFNHVLDCLPLAVARVTRMAQAWKYYR